MLTSPLAIARHTRRDATRHTAHAHRQYAKWQNEDITVVQRLEEELHECQQALARVQGESRQHAEQRDKLAAERQRAERERDEARAQEKAARQERERLQHEADDARRRLRAESDKADGMRKVLEQVKHEIDTVQRSVVEEREVRMRLEKELDAAVGRGRDERKRRERIEQELVAAQAQAQTERAAREKAQQDLEEKEWELENAVEQHEVGEKRARALSDALNLEKQLRLRLEADARAGEQERAELERAVQAQKQEWDDKIRTFKQKLQTKNILLKKQAIDLQEVVRITRGARHGARRTAHGARHTRHTPRKSDSQFSLQSGEEDEGRTAQAVAREGRTDPGPDHQVEGRGRGGPNA